MIFRWKDRDIEKWGDLENEFGRLLLPRAQFK